MQKINLTEWEARKIDISLYDSSIYSVYGCGATLISLITGTNPVSLYLKNKNKPHWSKEYVFRILKKHGFELLKMVPGLLVNTYHPIITIQRLSTAETSYQFIYNNLIYHNFDVRPLKNFEFLTFPIEESFLIRHKNWSIKKDKLESVNPLLS